MLVQTSSQAVIPKSRSSTSTLGGVLIVAALFSSVVSAQQQITSGVNPGDKSVAIVGLAADPDIDGRLDEAVWAQTDPIEDFHQFNPREFVEPFERTTVRMFYTEDALFISARMEESDTSRITAQVLRQGQGLNADDVFAVILDPYLDRRNGYRFEVNPNGVRWDGLFQNISEVEANWDGIWEAAAVRDDKGWTVEMKIPFQTISFNPEAGTWGINFFRARRSSGENIAWVSRNREVNPSVAGTMTGMTGLRQGIGLDVVPSFSMRERRKFGPGNFSDTNYEPSLDMFYKITPQLNAALTINTDFSATEVDDRQVNLTRFNLFFPEKRDFFLRDADIFEFGQIGNGGFNQNTGIGSPIASAPARQNARPFFSRNIGLDNAGNPVDIIAGAKVSGRVANWNVGTLVISQDEAPVTGVDQQNIFVGRAVLNVLSNSQVGVIVTDGDPQSNLGSTLMGADYRYRNSNLPGGKILEGVAYYEETDTDGKVGDNAAFGFGASLPSAQGVQGQYAYKRVEKNFSPAVGYVSRTGIDDHIFNIGYRHFVKPGGFVRSTLAAFDFYRAETLSDGKVSSQSFGPRLSLNTNRADNLVFRPTRSREVLLTDFTVNRFSDGSKRITIPKGDYTFDEVGLIMQMGQQRKFAANIFLNAGEYYDGNHFSRRTNISYRPNRNMSFELGYTEDEIHLRYGNFTVRQLSFNTQFAFSSTLSWSNLLQYDNVSEAVGFNSRLHWIPKAGQQAFLVLNWGLTDADKDNSFDSTVADLSLKMNYTFRF